MQFAVTAVGRLCCCAWTQARGDPVRLSGRPAAQPTCCCWCQEHGSCPRGVLNSISCALRRTHQSSMWSCALLPCGALFNSGRLYQNRHTGLHRVQRGAYSQHARLLLLPDHWDVNSKRMRLHTAAEELCKVTGSCHLCCCCCSASLCGVLWCQADRGC